MRRAELTPPELYLDRYPHELSGGQRQRVAIAASLVLGPELLVADEPVSMLDVSVRAGVLSLLDGLRRRGDVGILMITHDLSTAAHFADRIAVMYLGRIVEEGPARDVVRDPAASLHEGAAVGRSEAGSAGSHDAADPHGRDTEPGACAPRLPLPPALSGRGGSVSHDRPGARRDFPRTPSRLRARRLPYPAGAGPGTCFGRLVSGRGTGSVSGWLRGSAAPARRGGGGGWLLWSDLLLLWAILPPPAKTSLFVFWGPRNPPSALAAAEAAFRARGRSLGVDIAVGRHPSVDQAIRSAGLSLLFSWPAMAARVDGLPERSLPEGVRVEPVSDARGVAAVARVETALMDPAELDDGSEIADFYAAGSYGVEGARAFVAWEGDEPVGIASAHLRDGAIGIFGVGVVTGARRRGIASALSVVAAQAFPADLAWLHAAEGARDVYERLGFREVAMWEVWVRSD